VLASLLTAAVFGIDACPVHVEVDVSFGFPSFTMVGCRTRASERVEIRVRSAIKNSGFEFPAHRITVNLAPADVRKAGASFDLPIALGILAAQAWSNVGRSPIWCCSASCRSMVDPRDARRAAIAVAARRNGASGILLPAPTPARRPSWRTWTCSRSRLSPRRSRP